MPWIDKESCTGCGICVDECPVSAISVTIELADINMDECIRCGICHDVCPQDSIRHDSEKVPEKIRENIEITKKYMELCAHYLGSMEEKNKCLNRMKKHFNSQKIIAEKTLAELEKLQEN